MTTRAPGMTLAQFMTQGTGGGRNKYLDKKWKERGFAHVWLHPSAPILGLARHQFTRIHVNEDRETGAKTRDVYGDQLGCYESEEVQESANFRDKVTYRREVPPCVCPMCIMQEHLIELIVQKKIDWRLPIFKFEGTDPRKTKIYHAGGFTGMFQWKPEKLPLHCKLVDLSGAESGDPNVRAAQLAGQDPFFPASKWLGPVYQKGDNAAFSQDARVKPEFVFTVVDNDDVQAGVQVMFGGKGLAGKVQDAIAKAIKEARCPSDPEGVKGDPQRHPYVIRLEFNKVAGERDMTKYYDAMPMRQIPLTQQVYELLRSTPPDASKLAERFNLKQLRARLEEHMLVKLPLDSYFAKALELEAREKADAETKAQAEAARTPAERRAMYDEHSRIEQQHMAPPPPNPAFAQVPAAFAPSAVAPISEYSGVYPPVTQAAAPVNPVFVAPPPAAPVQEFDCDQCGKVLLATDTKCPHCGMVYVVEQAPVPPPPARPKRSSLGAAPAPAAPPPGFSPPAAPFAPPAAPAPAPFVPPPGAFGAPAAAPAPAVAPDPDPFNGDGFPGDPSDDIPF